MKGEGERKSEKRMIFTRKNGVCEEFS